MRDKKNRKKLTIAPGSSTTVEAHKSGATDGH
jgi:hypothetical protein